MSFIDILKARIGNAGQPTPGKLKSLLAFGATAWGTQALMGAATKALEEADNAFKHLEELNEAIEAHTAALNAISGQNKEAREAIVAQVMDGIHSGMYDHVVKARAVALGWSGSPDPTFPFGFMETVTLESPERSESDQPSDIGHEDQVVTHIDAVSAYPTELTGEPDPVPFDEGEYESDARRPEILAAIDRAAAAQPTKTQPRKRR